MGEGADTFGPFVIHRINGNGKTPPFHTLSVLTDNQSISFKGRAAQQAEHREAITKQRGSRQIELARI